MGFKCVYESLNEDTEQERLSHKIIHRMKAKESQEYRSQECIYCVWKFKGILSYYSTRYPQRTWSPKLSFNVGCGETVREYPVKA